MTKQAQAQLYYFLAIIEENGYYENLRKFMDERGYNYADMASMLDHQYDKNAPDGMSIYYFMDSLEDTLTELNEEGTGWQDLKDIGDIVETVYNRFWWKE